MNLEKQNIDNILNQQIPLCVDLDGTFLLTDSLLESILGAIKLKPIVLLLIPFWLLKGRANLKSQITKFFIPNVETLPINDEVLKFITEQKLKNRKIILTTATNIKVAENIVNNYAVFDEFFASSNENNLRASNKANFLIEKFGEKQFDYIGNSFDDLKVWQFSNNAILVNPSKNLVKKVQRINQNIVSISLNKTTFYDYIQQIRIHQWLKNILIFLPFLLAHKINLQNLINSTLAFIAFSFIASFVYIINDLFDLESDRRHPTKKYRPLACGKISISKAFFISLILFIAGSVISIKFLNIYFISTLAIYLFITTIYTFYVKRIVILDIITLSLLYTIRLIAGGVSTYIEVSEWLLGFSLFFFLSLATMKRYTELLIINEQNKTKTSGRGYSIKDISLIRTIGLSTGYLSVLIFSLYLNSFKVISLYKNPKILWLITLSLLYWISRLWLISHRGEMNDDPIIFIAKDKISYFIGIIIIILMIWASL